MIYVAKTLPLLNIYSSRSFHQINDFETNHSHMSGLLTTRNICNVKTCEQQHNNNEILQAMEEKKSRAQRDFKWTKQSVLNPWTRWFIDLARVWDQFGELAIIIFICATSLWLSMLLCLSLSLFHCSWTTHTHTQSQASRQAGRLNSDEVQLMMP